MLHLLLYTSQIPSMHGIMYDFGLLERKGEFPTTSGPNYIYRVDLLDPPKAQALDFLDCNGPRPQRFAKVIVIRPANTPKDIMEFKVGIEYLLPRKSCRVLLLWGHDWNNSWNSLLRIHVSLCPSYVRATVQLIKNTLSPPPPPKTCCKLFETSSQSTQIVIPTLNLLSFILFQAWSSFPRTGGPSAPGTTNRKSIPQPWC